MVSSFQGGVLMSKIKWVAVAVAACIALDRHASNTQEYITGDPDLPKWPMFIRLRGWLDGMIKGDYASNPLSTRETGR